MFFYQNDLILSQRNEKIIIAKNSHVIIQILSIDLESN